MGWVEWVAAAVSDGEWEDKASERYRGGGDGRGDRGGGNDVVIG